jgi:hypothetical protein
MLDACYWSVCFIKMSTVTLERGNSISIPSSMLMLHHVFREQFCFSIIWVLRSDFFEFYFEECDCICCLTISTTFLLACQYANVLHLEKMMWCWSFSNSFLEEYDELSFFTILPAFTVLHEYIQYNTIDLWCITIFVIILKKGEIWNILTVIVKMGMGIC